MDHDLLWAFALFLCAIAWGIVLVRRVEPGCGNRYSQISKAEQCASALLKEWLTRDQCVQYECVGYFEVRGSHSGKRYRIRPDRQMNVDQLDESGCRVAVVCFLPEKYLPVSDVMLAQKIVLENDELAALKVAIWHRS